MIAPGGYTTARSSRRWRRPVAYFGPDYAIQSLLGVKEFKAARKAEPDNRMWRRELRKHRAQRKRRRGWA